MSAKVFSGIAVGNLVLGKLRISPDTELHHVSAPRAEPKTEPKSGLPTGVWFEDKAYLGYKGTRPVVLEVEGIFRPEYRMSRCPSCDRSRLSALNIKRWMILPV